MLYEKIIGVRPELPNERNVRYESFKKRYGLCPDGVFVCAFDFQSAEIDDVCKGGFASLLGHNNTVAVSVFCVLGASGLFGVLRGYGKGCRSCYEAAF